MRQQGKEPLARHARGPHVPRDDVEPYFVVLRYDDGAADAWLLTDPMTGAATTPFSESEAVVLEHANDLLPVERPKPTHAALCALPWAEGRRCRTVNGNGTVTDSSPLPVWPLAPADAVAGTKPASLSTASRVPRSKQLSKKNTSASTRFRRACSFV